MLLYVLHRFQALVFMFDGGSSDRFTIHPILNRICMLYSNHTNNEKHMHHGFLAPQAYLRSTSLILFLYYTSGLDPYDILMLKT